MEESLTLLQLLKKEFACEEIDVRTYSPLSLAYLGDCVYDLIIRTVIIERGNKAANSLHKNTVKFVNAKAQSEMIEKLHEQLSLEEQSVYRRGRNAKSYTSAKNASIQDYRRATGFEALIGYLYLTNNFDRIVFLVKEGLRLTDLTI